LAAPVGPAMSIRVFVLLGVLVTLGAGVAGCSDGASDTATEPLSTRSETMVTEAPSSTAGGPTSVADPSTTGTTLVVPVAGSGATTADWSFPAGAVPPFYARIAWIPDQSQPSVDDGPVVTMEVWYETPRRFRWHLLEEGGIGDSMVADGEFLGLSVGGTWSLQPAFHYLAWMFWEPETAEVFDWAGSCGASAVLDAGTIAGRSVSRVSCVRSESEWDLWVDDATGLILRLHGPAPVDDLHLGFEPEGFRVIDIEVLEGAVPASEVLFSLRPPDELPIPIPGPLSLHAVFDEGGVTREAWRAGPGTWREEVVASEDPDVPVGSLTIVAEGLLTHFTPKTGDGYLNAYEIVEPSEAQPDKRLRLLDLFIDSAVTGATDCAVSGIEPVAGRPCIHRRCNGGTAGDWIDLESGLILRRLFTEVRVLSVEIDPVVPAGTFEFVPEPGSCDLSRAELCERDLWAGTRLRAGEPVTEFQGQLLDGTEFDLADLRGRPALILYWVIPCETGSCTVEELKGFLTDLDLLAATWGDQVAVLSINDTDPVGDVAGIVAGLGVTHDVVVCNPCPSLRPGSLWGFDKYAYVPVWVTVDVEGRAFDLLRDAIPSRDEIESLIIAVLEG